MASDWSTASILSSGWFTASILTSDWSTASILTFDWLQPIFWLCPNARVSHTLRAVAGDLFVAIRSPHEVLEDQRDGDNKLKEEEELLGIQSG